MPIAERGSRAQDLERARQSRFPKGSTTRSPTTRPSSSPESIHEVDQDAVRGVRPRRHRRLPLPRQPARDAHSAHRRAGLAGRHLRRDAGARLLRQHRLAAGAGAGHRHRRRRRHRGRRGGRGEAGGRIPTSRRPRPRKTAMGEITAPIIAITLVLLSVFVPVAFIPGISGQLFRQFAVAVSVSMVISAINALTLSPGALRASCSSRSMGRSAARCATILSGHRLARDGYAADRQAARARRRPRPRRARRRRRAATGWLFKTTPTGFLPAEDQGAFFGEVQLPEGSSVNRTNAVTRSRSRTILRADAGRRRRHVGRRLQLAGRPGQVQRAF